jgi:hypothetical protein
MTEDKKLAEDARLVYQVAASLWVHAGTLIWAKFNALLLAHSILLAGIGLSMTSEHRVPLLEAVLPVAGVALSLLWVLLIKRDFDYHAYWVWSTREVEEGHLAPSLRPVSRGGQFAAGQVDKIRLGGEEEGKTMPAVSRIKTEYLSYGVVAVFAALYVVLGLRAFGCL